jgi:hypothetical protein
MDQRAQYQTWNFEVARGRYKEIISVYFLNSTRIAQEIGARIDKWRDPRWWLVEGSRNHELLDFRKTLQSCGSYIWIILILFSQLNYHKHRVNIKFNAWPLKLLSVAHNSQGSPGAGWDQHSHWSALGKATGWFSLFAFLGKSRRLWNKLNWIPQCTGPVSCRHSLHTPCRPGSNSVRVNLQPWQVNDTHNPPWREWTT